MRNLCRVLQALTVAGFLFLLLLAGCGGGGASDAPLAAQYERVLTTADPAARVTQLLALAEKQQKAGDMSATELSLAAAADAAKQVEPAAARAASLNRVATAMGRWERPSESRKLLQAVARAAEQIENPAERVPELARAAYIQARYLNSREAAEAGLQQCEELAAGSGPSPARVDAHLRLAYTYHGLKMSERAESQVQAALAVARELEDPRRRAEAMASAAAQLAKMDRETPAKEAFQQAEQSLEEIADPLSRGYAYVHLAAQLRAAGLDGAAALTRAEELVDQVDRSLAGTLQEAIRAAR